MDIAPISSDQTHYSAEFPTWCPSLQLAVDQQQQIGKDSFILGHLSKQWRHMWPCNHVNHQTILRTTVFDGCRVSSSPYGNLARHYGPTWMPSSMANPFKAQPARNISLFILPSKKPFHITALTTTLRLALVDTYLTGHWRQRFEWAKMVLCAGWILSGRL